MNEMLLISARDPGVIMDIDFQDAAVGSTQIADRSGRVWTRNGSGAGAAVVNDPDHGHVLFLDGKTWYRTDLTPDMYLNTTNWKMTVEFKPANTTYSKLFSTGDYPSPAGLALSLNQYPATYIQAFLEQSGTNYRRLMVNLTNTLVWEKLVITREVNKPFTMTIFRDDVQVATTTLENFSFGNGSSAVGIVLGTTAGATGTQMASVYLKSLKIERLP